MKYCERCQQPITRPDEGYRAYTIDGASHGGATVFLHTYQCKRVPQQTKPAGRH